ncbi:ankyrin [Aspergillus steynii IBT 23096]|uniref:Ankyrin n=1 Tax=Aspergillus steynii IBT 23096 TaxID=1392250 RepID=A0A2I2G5N0_9EURO|nr:ankyrin [Aspergillus steynii IBT 23096]PLB48188.1 ankyrin [Aspergillus steynii IBT 23096]
MPFRALPPEIISYIADQLALIKDLYSLLRDNKNLFSILINNLYRRNIIFNGGSALIWYTSTVLIKAVLYKHTHVMRLLLGNGVLPDAADLHARRLLSVATSSRTDMVITKALLESGARLNALVFEKCSPLTEAIRTNQESKVVLFLEHGANPNTLRDRNTLLYIAASNNAGVPVDSRNDFGLILLQVATANSCVRAVRVLLHYGADPNFRGTHQYRERPIALFYTATKPRSCRKDNTAIIRALISHRAHVNIVNSEQKSPLLFAILKGAIKQAQTLLESGSNLMTRDTEGQTALHLAVLLLSYSLDMLNWLVSEGVNVNGVKRIMKETLIFNTIQSRRQMGIERQNREKYVQTLLSLGSYVNFQNLEGLTPISLAVRRGYIRLIIILLEYRALVNLRDSQGRLPLHYIRQDCFGYQGQELCSLLIANGADVNFRDHSGYTALHRLIERGSWEAVTELLKTGADRYAITHNRRSPHNIVLSGPWAETKQLFVRYYTQ